MLHENTSMKNQINNIILGDFTCWWLLMVVICNWKTVIDINLNVYKSQKLANWKNVKRFNYGTGDTYFVMYADKSSVQLVQL